MTPVCLCLFCSSCRSDHRGCTDLSLTLVYFQSRTKKRKQFFCLTTIKPQKAFSTSHMKHISDKRLLRKIVCRMFLAEVWLQCGCGQELEQAKNSYKAVTGGPSQKFWSSHEPLYLLMVCVITFLTHSFGVKLPITIEWMLYITQLSQFANLIPTSSHFNPPLSFFYIFSKQ